VSGWATATTRTPARKEPAISLTAAAPAVARVRARLHEELAGDELQTPEGRRQGHDRRVVRRQAGSVDEGEGRRRGSSRGRSRAPRRRSDPDGLLYSQSCGGYRVDLVKAELGPASWDADVADWMRRARGGPGRTGQYDSKTAYFWKQSSWGGSIAGPCYRARPHDDHGRNKDGKHGGKGKPPKASGAARLRPLRLPRHRRRSRRCDKTSRPGRSAAWGSRSVSRSWSG
jgi:hypothetical protein